MDPIASARLRICERCLLGAADADKELLRNPAFQRALVAVGALINGQYDYDAYALARNPKGTPAPTVNPSWQRLEKNK